jgi:hypothetical protein
VKQIIFELTVRRDPDFATSEAFGSCTDAIANLPLKCDEQCFFSIADHCVEQNHADVFQNAFELSQYSLRFGLSLADFFLVDPESILSFQTASSTS